MAKIQLIQNGIVIEEYEEEWKEIASDEKTVTVRNSRTGKVMTYNKKPIWTSDSIAE